MLKHSRFSRAIIEKESGTMNAPTNNTATTAEELAAHFLALAMRAPGEAFAPRAPFPDYANLRDCAVIARLVADGLARGYVVSVCDSEEWTVKQSADVVAILGACMTTESDALRFRDETGAVVGTVWTIYGNNGEALHDSTYSDACEELQRGAMDLVNRFMEGGR